MVMDEVKCTENAKKKMKKKMKMKMKMNSDGDDEDDEQLREFQRVWVLCVREVMNE